jgi:hypothetical protein
MWGINMKKIDPEDKLRCQCGEWAKPDNFRVEGTKIRGWSCRCGEKYFHPEDIEPLLTLNMIKRQGLVGKISKVGNSYGVRLPVRLVKALRLKIGTPLNIQVKDASHIELSIAS